MENNKSLQGFTLIELSVVLIIGGLLVVGALHAYEIYNEKQKNDRMEALMTDIDQAITNFAQSEQRLPCPAPMNSAALLPSGQFYDDEECGASYGIQQVNGTGGRPIYIGKLPTETLKLRNSYMKDIFGNYILYAVTVDATTDASSTGGITVTEEHIDENPDSPTFGQILDMSHNDVLYTVVSFGDQGIGAYAFDGTRTLACDGTTREGMNCQNNNSNFREGFSGDNGAADQYYDDWVLYRSDIGGSLASLPNVLVSADRDVDFRELSGPWAYNDYEILEDGYAQWRWQATRLQYGDGSSGNDFFEVKKGDTLKFEHDHLEDKDNMTLYDSSGNVVDRNSRKTDEDFIFAVNPNETSDIGFDYNYGAAVGGQEGYDENGFKSLKIYKQK